ncbi:MAG: hypothetical protein JNM18_09160, partial [Planctomycetaceae bacterium]|nr:hypothetical protein [Planctomycetaceae bacterium]
MPTSPDRGRRDLLKASLLAAGASSLPKLTPIAHAGAAAASRQPDLIRHENQRPGHTNWQLTRVRLDKRDGFRTPWIEGYCSRQSVSAGESIDIMVSTNPAQRFSIEIFRMGYYGGTGARLMTTLGPFQGKTQLDPEVGPRRLRECHWEPT